MRNLDLFSVYKVIFVASKEPTLQHREMILVAFCLAVGIALRLIDITRPFIGGWSWRQADVAMIAENFYRNRFNIFYPQIDWAGDSPGYVGTEFPLVPFLASLLYLLFGVQEWIGRSVSVFFFALSVPFLYFFVKKIFNERSALFAVAIYDLAPLSIFAGRSFMPDMTSLSLSIMAIYLFALWLDRPPPRAKLLLAAGAVTSLAILVKLPAIIIGLPLLYMSWREYGAKSLLRKELWVFAILSLIIPLAWYFHAYLISVNYAPHHMFGNGGIALDTPDTYVTILRRGATYGLTPLLSATMLVGIFLPPLTKFGRVFHWWLVAILFFALIAAPGHYRHLWYLLPMVPVAAAFGGSTCDFVLTRLSCSTRSRTLPTLICLLFFCSLSYLSLAYVRPYYRASGLRFLHAGMELNHIAPRHALVAVADGGDPTCLYYSRRKGWHFLENFGAAPSNSQQAITELERLRKRGATYLVFTRNTKWWLDQYQGLKSHLDSRYARVSETGEYVIFDLSDRRAEQKP